MPKVKRIMKKLRTHVVKTSKAFSAHVKKHGKHYVFGGFGAFAVVKAIIFFVGLMVGAGNMTSASLSQTLGEGVTSILEIFGEKEGNEDQYANRVAGCLNNEEERNICIKELFYGAEGLYKEQIQQLRDKGVFEKDEDVCGITDVIVVDEDQKNLNDVLTKNEFNQYKLADNTAYILQGNKVYSNPIVMGNCSLLVSDKNTYAVLNYEGGPAEYLIDASSAVAPILRGIVLDAGKKSRLGINTTAESSLILDHVSLSDVTDGEDPMIWGGGLIGPVGPINPRNDCPYPNENSCGTGFVWDGECGCVCDTENGYTWWPTPFIYNPTDVTDPHQLWGDWAWDLNLYGACCEPGWMLDKYNEINGISDGGKGCVPDVCDVDDEPYICRAALGERDDEACLCECKNPLLTGLGLEIPESWRYERQYNQLQNSGGWVCVTCLYEFRDRHLYDNLGARSYETGGFFEIIAECNSGTLYTGGHTVWDEDLCDCVCESGWYQSGFDCIPATCEAVYIASGLDYTGAIQSCQNLGAGYTWYESGTDCGCRCATGYISSGGRCLSAMEYPDLGRTRCAPCNITQPMCASEGLLFDEADCACYTGSTLYPSNCSSYSSNWWPSDDNSRLKLGILQNHFNNTIYSCQDKCCECKLTQEMCDLAEEGSIFNPENCSCEISATIDIDNPEPCENINNFFGTNGYYGTVTKTKNPKDEEKASCDFSCCQCQLNANICSDLGGQGREFDETNCACKKVDGFDDATGGDCIRINQAMTTYLNFMTGGTGGGDGWLNSTVYNEDTKMCVYNCNPKCDDRNKETCESIGGVFNEETCRCEPEQCICKLDGEICAAKNMAFQSDICACIDESDTMNQSQNGGLSLSFLDTIFGNYGPDRGIVVCTGKLLSGVDEEGIPYDEKERFNCAYDCCECVLDADICAAESMSFNAIDCACEAEKNLEETDLCDQVIGGLRNEGKLNIPSYGTILATGNQCKYECCQCKLSEDVCRSLGGGMLFNADQCVCYPDPDYQGSYGEGDPCENLNNNINDRFGNLGFRTTLGEVNLGRIEGSEEDYWTMGCSYKCGSGVLEQTEEPEEPKEPEEPEKPDCGGDENCERHEYNNRLEYCLKRQEQASCIDNLFYGEDGLYGYQIQELSNQNVFGENSCHIEHVVVVGKDQTSLDEVFESECNLNDNTAYILQGNKTYSYPILMGDCSILVSDKDSYVSLEYQGEKLQGAGDAFVIAKTSKAPLLRGIILSVKPGSDIKSEYGIYTDSNSSLILDHVLSPNSENLWGGGLIDPVNHPSSGCPYPNENSCGTGFVWDGTCGCVCDTENGYTWWPTPFIYNPTDITDPHQLWGDWAWDLNLSGACCEPGWHLDQYYEINGYSYGGKGCIRNVCYAEELIYMCQSAGLDYNLVTCSCCKEGEEYDGTTESCVPAGQGQDSCTNPEQLKKQCISNNGDWDEENCRCNCHEWEERSMLCEDMGGTWSNLSCSCLCPEGTVFNKLTGKCEESACGDPNDEELQKKIANCQKDDKGVWNSNTCDCECVDDSYYFNGEECVANVVVATSVCGDNEVYTNNGCSTTASVSTNISLIGSRDTLGNNPQIGDTFTSNGPLQGVYQVTTPKSNSYVTFGNSDTNFGIQGEVVVDNFEVANIDYTIKAPEVVYKYVDRGIKVLGEKINPLVVYSVGTVEGIQLTLTNNNKFTIFFDLQEVVKNPKNNVKVGSKLKVYRSDDGKIWQNDGDCIINNYAAGIGCYVESNSLSEFAFDWKDVILTCNPDEGGESCKCEEEQCYCNNSSQWYSDGVGGCIKDDGNLCKDITCGDGGVLGIVNNKGGEQICICLSCGEGYNLDEENGICNGEAEPMVTCEAGQYLDGNDCKICLAGSYCEGGTFTPNGGIQGINSCPDGYTGGSESASNINECKIICEAGTYLKTGNASSCTACENGTYSAQNTVNYGSTSSCSSCTGLPVSNAHWTSNGTSANSCTWSCNNSYHGSGSNQCVSNTMSVSCMSEGMPEGINAHYNVQNVTITWNNGWPTAPNCSWDCNEGYIKSGEKTCIACTMIAGGISGEGEGCKCKEGLEWSPEKLACMPKAGSLTPDQQCANVGLVYSNGICQCDSQYAWNGDNCVYGETCTNGLTEEYCKVLEGVNGEDPFNGVDPNKCACRCADNYQWNESSRTCEKQEVVCEAGRYLNGNDCEKCADGYTTSNGGATDVSECKRTVIATFEKNGATSIGSASLTCEQSQGSTCTVTAPTITRDGFSIKGWNTVSSATTGSVSVGGTITLNGNETYYAITDKTVTATFNKGNGVEAVNPTTKTCIIRNTATTCNITPMATATCLAGYTNPIWTPSSLNGIENNTQSTAQCESCGAAPDGASFVEGEGGDCFRKCDDMITYSKEYCSKRDNVDENDSYTDNTCGCNCIDNYTWNSETEKCEKDELDCSKYNCENGKAGVSGDGQSCTCVKCNDGYELDSGECVEKDNCDANVRENCAGTSGTWIKDKCECECYESFYHQEGGLCIENEIPNVQCITGSKPDNSEYQITMSTIYWEPEFNRWSEIPLCSWKCNDGYHEQDDQCILDLDCSGQDKCELDGSWDSETCECQCRDGEERAKLCADSNGTWSSNTCECSCADGLYNKVTGRCEETSACKVSQSLITSCKDKGDWNQNDCRCECGDGLIWDGSACVNQNDAVNASQDSKCGNGKVLVGNTCKDVAIVGNYVELKGSSNALLEGDSFVANMSQGIYKINSKNPNNKSFVVIGDSTDGQYKIIGTKVKDVSSKDDFVVNAPGITYRYVDKTISVSNKEVSPDIAFTVGTENGIKLTLENTNTNEPSVFTIYFDLEDLVQDTTNDVTVGSKLKVYKSDDGEEWKKNGICDVEIGINGIGCYVESDSLSDFVLDLENIKLTCDPNGEPDDPCKCDEWGMCYCNADEGYYPNGNGECIKDDGNLCKDITCGDKNNPGIIGIVNIDGEDRCVCLSCTEGYNLNQDDLSCEKDGIDCDGSCENGTAGDNGEGECVCTSCEDGYTLEGGECVLDQVSCDLGYYRDGDECKQCHEIGDGFSEWTSSGTNATNCSFNCKEGYHQDDRSCEPYTCEEKLQEICEGIPLTYDPENSACIVEGDSCDEFNNIIASHQYNWSTHYITFNDGQTKGCACSQGTQVCDNEQQCNEGGGVGVDSDCECICEEGKVWDDNDKKCMEIELPKCEISANSIDPTSGSVILTINGVGQDSFSWDGVTFNNDNTTIVSSNGRYTGYVRNAGGIGDCVIDVSNIDKTGPDCNLTTPSEVVQGNTDTIVITCTDENGVNTNVSDNTLVSSLGSSISFESSGKNGDEYTFTFSYTATDNGSGRDTVTLLTGKIKDILGNGNDEVSEDVNVKGFLGASFWEKWPNPAQYTSSLFTQDLIKELYGDGSRYRRGWTKYECNFANTTPVVVRNISDISAHLAGDKLSQGIYVIVDNLNLQPNSITLKDNCTVIVGKNEDKKINGSFVIEGKYSIIDGINLNGFIQIQNDNNTVNVSKDDQFQETFIRKNMSISHVNINVENDNEKPTCAWGIPSKTHIKVGQTGEITLTCIDNIDGIYNLAFTPGYSGNLVTQSMLPVSGLSNSVGYTFVYTGTDQNGSFSFTLPEQTIRDEGGRFANPAESTTITVDNTAPVCNITTENPVVLGTNSTITLSCNEEIATVVTNDSISSIFEISFTDTDNNTIDLNDTIGTLTYNSKNGNTYTFNYLGNIEGTLSITLKPGVLEDLVGNTNGQSGPVDLIIGRPLWMWGDFVNTGFWTSQEQISLGGDITPENEDKVKSDLKNVFFGDNSPYIATWDNDAKCDISIIKVEFVKDGSIKTIEDNTIYVLQGDVILSNSISINDKKSCIVITSMFDNNGDSYKIKKGQNFGFNSNKSRLAWLFGSVYAAETETLINVQGGNGIILDNLNVSEGNIDLNNSSNVTFNNVSSNEIINHGSTNVSYNGNTPITLSAISNGSGYIDAEFWRNYSHLSNNTRLSYVSNVLDGWPYNYSSSYPCNYTQVIEINNGSQLNNLRPNAIYIIKNPLTLVSNVSILSKCIALLSSGKSIDLNGYTISILSPSNIIDGVNFVNGKNIYINGEYTTVNNISVSSMTDDQGALLLGNNVILTNSKLFNNSAKYGIKASGKNILNNLQVFNNKSIGVLVEGATNAINNVQVYNNGAVGIQASSSNNVFNNIQSYNNGGYGFDLIGGNYIRKIQSYNNNGGLYITPGTPLHVCGDVNDIKVGSVAGGVMDTGCTVGTDVTATGTIVSFVGNKVEPRKATLTSRSNGGITSISQIGSSVVNGGGNTTLYSADTPSNPCSRLHPGTQAWYNADCEGTQGIEDLDPCDDPENRGLEPCNNGGGGGTSGPTSDSQCSVTATVTSNNVCVGPNNPVTVTGVGHGTHTYVGVLCGWSGASSHWGSTYSCTGGNTFTGSNDQGVHYFVVHGANSDHTCDTSMSVSVSYDSSSPTGVRVLSAGQQASNMLNNYNRFEAIWSKANDNGCGSGSIIYQPMICSDINCSGAIYYSGQTTNTGISFNGSIKNGSYFVVKYCDGAKNCSLTGRQLNITGLYCSMVLSGNAAQCTSSKTLNMSWSGGSEYRRYGPTNSVSDWSVLAILDGNQIYNNVSILADSEGVYTGQVRSDSTSIWYAECTGSVSNIDTQIPSKPVINPISTNNFVVPFTWDAVTDSGCGSGNITYTLEVCNNSDCSSVKHKKTGILGTGYIFSGFNDVGTYYWRLQAIDGVGNTGLWSTVQTIDLLTGLCNIVIPNTCGTGKQIYISRNFNSNIASSQDRYSFVSFNSLSTTSGTFVTGNRLYTGYITVGTGYRGMCTAIVTGIDRVGPQISNVSSVASFVNIAPSVSWSGIDQGCSSVSGFIVKVCKNPSCNGSNLLHTSNFLPSNMTTYTIPVALPAGSYYWYIEAYDALGNKQIDVNSQFSLTYLGVSESWDYVTNPQSIAGYLTNWLNSAGNINNRGYTGGFTTVPYRYSFGQSIFGQEVLYMDNSINVNLPYDKNSYIGSDLNRVTGDLMLPSSTINVGDTITVTGTSNSNLIGAYNITGNIMGPLFQAISIGGQVTLETVNNRLITQLTGRDYFATHFETVVEVPRCLSGWNNDGFINEKFWSDHNNGDLSHIICALYGEFGQNDDTAYTYPWRGHSCNTGSSSMNVVTGVAAINALLNGNLNSYTVYVVDTGNVLNIGSLGVPECTSIISQYGVTLSGTVNLNGGYSIIDNVDIKGNKFQSDGISTVGHYNTINKAKIYSTYRGINGGFDNKSLSVNNTQIFNNNLGINGNRFSNLVLNNVQVYNNSGYGIKMNKIEYSALNNIYIYNNKTGLEIMGDGQLPSIFRDLYIYNNSVGLYYSGNNNPMNLEGGGVFANRDINCDSYSNNINNCISNNYSISWDWLANPSYHITGNIYLMDFTNFRFNNFIGKTVNFIDPVLGISYGKNIGGQKRPISYDGNAFGSFDLSKYVGSNVNRDVSGYVDKIVSYHDQGQNYYLISVVGDAQNYTVFDPVTLSRSIGSMSYVKDNKFVVQLNSGSYFATHFQEIVQNTESNCLPGWDGNKFMDEDFWALNPNYENIVCAVYGADGIPGGFSKTVYDSAFDSNNTTPIHVIVIENDNIVINLFGLGGFNANHTLSDPGNTLYIISGTMVANNPIKLYTGSAIVGYPGSKIVGSVQGGQYSIFDNINISGTLVLGENNVVNNLQVHDSPYERGITLGKGAVVNNTQIFNNNIGIYYVGDSLDDVVLANNLQIFNNEEGISLSKGGLAINNSQIYNNNNVLSDRDEAKVLFNNSAIYNNEDTVGEVNNVTVYIYGNYYDYKDEFISKESIKERLGVGVNNIVKFDDSDFWNYITNPKGNNYLSPRNTGAKQGKISTPFITNKKANFSYGKDVLEQSPLRTFVLGSDVGAECEGIDNCDAYYDKSKFIGGSTRISEVDLVVPQYVTTGGNTPVRVTGYVFDANSNVFNKYIVSGYNVSSSVTANIGYGASVNFVTRGNENTYVLGEFSGQYLGNPVFIHDQNSIVWDRKSPSITGFNDASGYECQSITLRMEGIDDNTGSLSYRFTGSLVPDVDSGWVAMPNGWYSMNVSTGSIGNYVVYGSIKDYVGNQTGSSITVQVKDSLPRFENSDGQISKFFDFNNGSDNIDLSEFDAVDGDCGPGTMSFSGVVYKSDPNLSVQISPNSINVDWNNVTLDGIAGYFEVSIQDDEGNIIIGRVNYSFDSNNCLAGWDNDRFIGEDFWNLWKTQEQDPDNNLLNAIPYLACAIYGYKNGNIDDSETVYNKYFSSDCPNDPSQYQGNPGSIVTSVSNYINIITGSISSIISLDSECTALVGYGKDPTINNGEIELKNIGVVVDGIIVDEGGNDKGVIANYDAVVLNNVEIFGTTSDGLSVNSENGIMYSIINNVRVHDNEGAGIHIDGQEHILNNIQAFNNNVGIQVVGSEIAINNSQVYNNREAGITISSNRTFLNNLQIYANKYGILSDESGIPMGDTYVYNNDGDLVNGNGEDYYAMIQEMGGNVYDCGDNGERCSLADWFTNPSYGDGKYLWTDWENLSEYDAVQQKVEGYSYGSGIRTQLQPILDDNQTPWGNDRETYDSQNYIGGGVKKVGGIATPTQQMFTGIDRRATYTWTGSSLVNSYTVFRDGDSSMGINSLGSQISIKLAPGNGSKNDVVLQILSGSNEGSGYFATHFTIPSVDLNVAAPTCINLIHNYDTGICISGSVNMIIEGTGINDNLIYQLDNNGWGSNSVYARSEGLHTGYVAYIVDGQPEARNPGICTGIVDVVDTKGPIVTIQSPAAGVTMVNTGFDILVDIVWSATGDASCNSGISGYEYIIQKYNSNIVVESGIVASNVTGIIFTGENNQRYYLKVRGFDGLGNPGYWATRTFKYKFRQGLRIGVPRGTGFVATTGSTKTITFDSPFWVEDKRGSTTGHYTTIQCKGLVLSGQNNVSITGVTITPGSLSYVGTGNGTSINSGEHDITDPVLYIYRVNGADNSGAINRYYDNPSFKITVPSNATAGTYRGEILFTLYDNDTPAASFQSQ